MAPGAAGKGLRMACGGGMLGTECIAAAAGNAMPAHARNYGNREQRRRGLEHSTLGLAELLLCARGRRGLGGQGGREWPVRRISTCERSQLQARERDVFVCRAAGHRAGQKSHTRAHARMTYQQVVYFRGGRQLLFGGVWPRLFF